MSTLNQELNAIKAVEDTLTANKVANFAYTQEAYDNNDADGVEEYDFDQEQNIPVADLDILRVNETVLNKGWRSQASAITRMLMNHFLGRLSYNLNKLNDNVSNLLSTLIAKAGNADGFATLDSNGRIPYSQLPEDALELKGYWDASTNTPTLANGTGTKGDLYVCSVGGSVDFGSGTTIAFLPNDRVVYNGTVWEKLAGGEVRTVGGVAPNPATGDVPLSVNGVSPDNTGNIQLELDWANAYYIVCFAFNTNGGNIVSAGSITIPADGVFVPISIATHTVSSSQELKTYLDNIFTSDGISIKQYINAEAIDQTGIQFDTTQNKVRYFGTITAPEPKVYLGNVANVRVINLSVTSYPLGTDLSAGKLLKSSVELRKSVFKQGDTLSPVIVGGNQGVSHFCGGLLFVPYKK